MTTKKMQRENKILFYLWPKNNEVSTDSIAATVKAWARQPYTFASNKVLESEGSNGSSAYYEKFELISSQHYVVK